MRSASTSVFKKALQSLKPKMTGAYAFFPMPQISPTMGSGQILRWHVAKGDCTQSNDLLVDVKVDKLVQVEDKENFEMLEAEMEIEVIESMYVAKLLRPVGETIQCGEPIAILCDEEDDIPALSALEIPDGVDLYDPNLSEVTVALWQGYSKDKGAAGSKCG